MIGKKTQIAWYWSFADNAKGVLRMLNGPVAAMAHPKDLKRRRLRPIYRTSALTTEKACANLLSTNENCRVVAAHMLSLARYASARLGSFQPGLMKWQV